MGIVGFAMIAVFGFLTFRNFKSGRLFWGMATGLGLLIGMANVWIEYDRSNNPRPQIAQNSGDASTDEKPEDPWSDESADEQWAEEDSDEDDWSEEDADDSWSEDI